MNEQGWLRMNGIRTDEEMFFKLHKLWRTVASLQCQWYTERVQISFILRRSRKLVALSLQTREVVEYFTVVWRVFSRVESVKVPLKRVPTGEKKKKNKGNCKLCKRNYLEHWFADSKETLWLYVQITVVLIRYVCIINYFCMDHFH